MPKKLNVEEQVMFLGPVPEREKECLYRIADLFVYAPIKTEIPEEWPIPPLEALKTGTPVIISDVVGSIPDIIDGLLVVSSGDVEELTEAIKLCYNPDLCRKLAEAWQKRSYR